MAVDWDALTTRLARILTDKYMDALTWTDVTTSITALTLAEKNTIVDHIKAGKALEVGQIVTRTVGTAAAAKAQLEASAMLADQTLTPAELDRLFGA